MRIKENGTVVINLSSVAEAFAKYTFERCVKQRGILLTDKHNEIYWATRKYQSLEEINEQANKMGLIDYTLSLNFSPFHLHYTQCLLAIIAGRTSSISIIDEESLERAAILGYEGSFKVHPPLQEAGEEEYCLITVKNGKIKKEWFDLEYYY